MHISDGILNSEVVIASSIIGFALLIFAIKDLKNENIAIVSSMSAMFFISSFIHIPLGPTQIHLILIGLIGILLGKAVFLSIFISLLLQAVLLGYGGLTSLGANLIIMALPAYIIHLLVKNGLLNFLNIKLRYFFIGFLAVFLSTVLLALILIISKEEYFYVALTVIASNIPAMILEGLVTLFLINYIKKAMPQLLQKVHL